MHASSIELKSILVNAVSAVWKRRTNLHTDTHTDTQQMIWSDGHGPIVAINKQCNSREQNNANEMDQLLVL